MGGRRRRRKKWARDKAVEESVWWWSAGNVEFVIVGFRRNIESHRTPESPPFFCLNVNTAAVACLGVSRFTLGSVFHWAVVDYVPER